MRCALTILPALFLCAVAVCGCQKYDACAGSPAPGQVCADGSVYVGLSPVDFSKMFTTPTDQEHPRDMDSYVMYWKKTTGANDIDPDSVKDGQLNHANRSGDIEDFPAFLACEKLRFGGHSDWYLPAIEELNILYEKREAIGDFKYGFYWSSTESNTNDVWNQNFNFGSRIHNSETNNYRVRCVRR